jgi:hypothetical protein
MGVSEEYLRCSVTPTGIKRGWYVVVMTMSKATKGLITLTPEKDCDQTAMDLPPVTSVVT